MEPNAQFIYAAKATQKYLAQHSEVEAELGELIRARCAPFGHGLAIPCYEESEGILDSLATLAPGPLGPALIVVVVNAPRDAAPHVHAANAQTLEGLRREYGVPKSITPSTCLYPHPAGTILVIDRASENFLPTRQGVGLARKIGADLLLALIEARHIHSPWIHCSDADVRFPSDYFERVAFRGQNGHSALLYPFQHTPPMNSSKTPSPEAGAEDSEPRLHHRDAAYQAGLQYEISLRYYVLGLQFAGSLYAFQSIGSTLAIHANAYAQVRGFPRREAAEDFYLLNKLAKVGRVETLPGRPLLLSSRTSSRVPFGTGAAIRRLVEPGSSEITTYDPRVFHYLRVWQRTLSQAFTLEGSGASLSALLRLFAEEDPAVDREKLTRALEKITAISNAKAALSGPRKGAERRILDRFDGFQTLKLIHTLRESGLEDLPLRKALGQASFIPLPLTEGSDTFDELAMKIETLERSVIQTVGSAAKPQEFSPPE